MLMVAAARHTGRVDTGRAPLRLVEPWRPTPAQRRDWAAYALPLLWTLIVCVVSRDPLAGAAFLVGYAGPLLLWRAVTGPWRRSLRGR